MVAMLSLMFLPFGRASRITFLGGFGALMLLSPLVAIILSLIYRAVGQTGIPFTTTPTLSVTAWVVFCLFANRLHDIGRSALWAVAPVLVPTFLVSGLGGFSEAGFGLGGIMAIVFAPFLYMSMGVVLLCFRGHDGPNRFGYRPAIA